MKYIDTKTYDLLRTRSNPYLAEQDFLECKLLSQLFENPDLFNQCVFAGGASLAKSYGLTYRTCQDLDISCIDFREIPENRTKRQLTQYKRDFKEFIFDKILAEVKYTINQYNYFSVLTDRQIARGTQSSPVLHLFANSVLDNHQIQISIEFIPRNYAPDQISVRTVTPYSTNNPIGHIPTVAFQQTFWDKIYALHANTQLENPHCTYGFSRHYYDAALVSDTVDLAQTYGMLFNIAKRQSAYTTYNLPEIKSMSDVCLIPSNDTLNKLATDYAVLATTCRKTPPTWQQIISKLKQINSAINNLQVQR
ncbi:MAG: nucleotidyl transferase AbiEii/AbiGii toxin family protein [Muribaculaceae bacterium]|nr:nucleotidyl transferase AbiEii/AbiGii toxin family protein [Muribaculaceae bacterium]